MSSQNGHGAISAGDILVRTSAPLPDAVRLEGDSTAPGWAPISGNPSGGQLEKELGAAGWTLFFMAGEMRITAFGFDQKSVNRTALNRLIEMARLNRCNCLEIEKVAQHSFLGLPYLSISARSRHIQRGLVFAGQ